MKTQIKIFSTAFVAMTLLAGCGKKETSNDIKCLLNQKRGKKISRNEKCDATGKKFKNCCGSL